MIDEDPFYDPEADDSWKHGPKHEPKHKKPSKRKSGQGAALHPAAERWARDNFPGYAWGKLEGARFTGGGGVVKSDFEGFADFMLYGEGGLIFVQVTTAGDVSRHLTKYRTGVWGTNKTPIRDNIRRWLEVGALFVILGFEKVRGKWVPTETWVTSYMLKKRGEK